MSELYEVKRVVAQGLLHDLKAFAFEQSPGLRENTDAGIEIAKAFYHNDPVPYELAETIGREVCKSSFAFSAFVVPRVRNKRSFAYSTEASIERTMTKLSDYQMSLMDPEIVDAYKGFEEIDDGALSEATSIELTTSDHQIRQIDVSQEYAISYAGDIIYRNNSQDILYGNVCTIATIDRDESEDYLDKFVIPEAIDHEKLPPAENVIANIDFWAIISPFRSHYEEGVSFNSAATQMRKIIHTLRAGQM